MRHATQHDLDQLEALLAELRTLPQLRERKRGYFSLGSRAFLHFHEDAGELYVDVRLGSRFQRMRITSRDERAALLSQVQGALGRPLDKLATGAWREKRSLEAERPLT